MEELQCASMVAKGFTLRSAHDWLPDDNADLDLYEFGQFLGAIRVNASTLFRVTIQELSNEEAESTEAEENIGGGGKDA